MARIKFDLPDDFAFRTEVQVYISHVNQGGHLDNAQLLTLISEARVRFFQWLGYQELDIEGVQIVVADLVAQYMSEAFHGETLVVDVTPEDFNKYGFDLVYCLREKGTRREVARGKIGAVFVEQRTLTLCPIPPAFLERLSARRAA